MARYVLAGTTPLTLAPHISTLYQAYTLSLFPPSPLLHSRKQRILKYPVNQDTSDLHYRVSNYPDKFPHLEQLVQHYRHTSISSKETVLLREPVNGWPKSKGEYGVFVRPSESEWFVHPCQIYVQMHLQCICLCTFAIKEKPFMFEYTTFSLKF